MFHWNEFPSFILYYLANFNCANNMHSIKTRGAVQCTLFMLSALGLCILEHDLLPSILLLGPNDTFRGYETVT
jgi:hypothetical protein